MQEASETFRSLHTEKLAREQRVIDTLETVKGELIASGKREAEALRRVEAAERYNESMRRIAVASLIVSILAVLVGTAIAIIFGG